MAIVRHYSGVRESISIDLILSMRAVKEKVRESNKETSRANCFSNLCVVFMIAADLILGLLLAVVTTLSYSFLFLFYMVTSFWWRWFSIAHRLPMINSTACGTLRTGQSLSWPAGISTAERLPGRMNYDQWFLWLHVYRHISRANVTKANLIWGNTASTLHSMILHRRRNSVCV